MVKPLMTLGLNADHSAFSEQREADDFYATHPDALRLFPLRQELSNVWECAVGQGHLAQVLANDGSLGRISDIIDRGCRVGGLHTELVDFLDFNGTWDGDILTNPPFKHANKFVTKALDILAPGRKLCLFLPIRYLEGKTRRKVFDSHPPAYVYVSSGRLRCTNLKEDPDFTKASAVAYAWFVWVKAQKNRETILRWFN